MKDHNQLHVEVEKDGQKVNLPIEMKVDTVKPTVTMQNYDFSVKTGSQEIKFTYQDNTEVAKCYFSKEKSLNNATWSDCIESKKYIENTTEYLYVQDSAGNISNPLEIKITNIVDDHDAR